MAEEIITQNFEETRKIGETLAKKILASKGLAPDKAVMVALYGDLGSGKTTFVQGLAKGLGIKRRIISPTFVLLRRYKLKVQSSKVKTKTQNAKVFYHMDLYRIENQSKIECLGIQELLNDPGNIIVIEWAEKIKSLLPEKRWDIRLESIDENKREIIITH